MRVCVSSSLLVDDVSVRSITKITHCMCVCAIHTHEVVRCFTSIYSILRTHAVNCLCRDDDDDDDVDTVSRLYTCVILLSKVFEHRLLTSMCVCVFSERNHLNEKHFHSFFNIVIRFAVVVFFPLSLSHTLRSFFHTKIIHFTTEKANKY